MIAPLWGCTLVELPPATMSQRSGGGDETALSRRTGIPPSAAAVEPPLGGPLHLLLRSLPLLPGTALQRVSKGHHSRSSHTSLLMLDDHGLAPEPLHRPSRL